VSGVRTGEELTGPPIFFDYPCPVHSVHPDMSQRFLAFRAPSDDPCLASSPTTRYGSDYPLPSPSALIPRPASSALRSSARSTTQLRSIPRLPASARTRSPRRSTTCLLLSVPFRLPMSTRLGPFRLLTAARLWSVPTTLLCSSLTPSFRPLCSFLIVPDPSTTLVSLTPIHLRLSF
jgi:hypothetical protein